MNAPRRQIAFCTCTFAIDQIAEMTDHDTVRLHAGVFEQIELLERRLSGDSGVRENRQVGRQVRLADRAEHFALVGGDVVPRSDLAEHADRIGLDLLDQRLTICSSLIVEISFG